MNTYFFIAPLCLDYIFSAIYRNTFALCFGRVPLTFWLDISAIAILVFVKFCDCVLLVANLLNS